MPKFNKFDATNENDFEMFLEIGKKMLDVMDTFECEFFKMLLGASV